MKLPKVNDLRTNKTCELTRVFSRKVNVLLTIFILDIQV